MKKKTYKVQNMSCTSCAMLIETELEDISVKAKCSYAKESLEVEYDEKKVNEEHIKKTVKNLGYTIVPR